MNNYTTDIAVFSSTIFGYIVRLKEIHYSAENMDIHRLSDELIGKLRDYEDSAMEIMQASQQIVQVGDINVISMDMECDTIASVVCEILTYVGAISNNYPMIRNITEDLIDYLNKSLYLYDKM